MAAMFTFSAFGALSRGVALADELEKLNPSDTFFLDSCVPNLTALILLAALLPP